MSIEKVLSEAEQYKLELHNNFISCIENTDGLSLIDYSIINHMPCYQVEIDKDIITKENYDRFEQSFYDLRCFAWASLSVREKITSCEIKSNVI